jgi:PAS domain S-box-containing protein
LNWVRRRQLPPNSVKAHAFALLCALAAVCAQILLVWWGLRLAPAVLLFPAIVLAGLIGGAWAGATTLAVGVLATWFVLLPDAGPVVITPFAQLAGIVLFSATALLLVGFATIMRSVADDLTREKETASGAHDRLLAALEASGAGTWRWDIQNDVVEWDDALCRLYGIAPENAPRTAEAFMSLVHPDDRKHAGEAIQNCVGGIADAEYEFRAIVPKGLLYIYDRSKLVRDEQGRPAYMMGACLDVTARRVAEEESRRVATWLNMAMEVTQIGTWEVDPKTHMVTGSDTMNSLFGLPADGRSRPFQAYLERIHPDDAPRVVEAVERRSIVVEPISVEYRVLRDGEERWLASRGALVRSTGRIVGSLIDITDRKRIEQEREAALRQRELLLKELNHRVKNNLQMVSSLLSLQASRMSDAATKEQFRKAMDRVHAVGDIHARLYQGDHLGQIEFDEYLRDLCARLRDSMLDNKSIAIDVDAEPVMLDLDRAIPLGLIVNELVTNSIKHAFPNGAGGRISVQLRHDRDDDALCLSIGDSGCGFTDKNGDDRSGLGMRLVDGLMLQIGGTIERAEGPGARYEIRVPGSGAARAAADPTVQPRAAE